MARVIKIYHPNAPPEVKIKIKQFDASSGKEKEYTALIDTGARGCGVVLYCSDLNEPRSLLGLSEIDYSEGTIETAGGVARCKYYAGDIVIDGLNGRFPIKITAIIPVTSTEINYSPPDFSGFGAPLNTKISYRKYGSIGHLIFEGIMTSGEKNTLQGLPGNGEYKQDIEKLFNDSNSKRAILGELVLRKYLIAMHGPKENLTIVIPK